MYTTIGIVHVCLVALVRSGSFRNFCLSYQLVDSLFSPIIQSFSVMLTSPVGGAQLGNPLTATITISQNDDLNGVFSFAPGSLVVGLDAHRHTHTHARARARAHTYYLGCCQFSIVISY